MIHQLTVYFACLGVSSIPIIVQLCRRLAAEQTLHHKYADRARRYRCLTQFWRERGRSARMIPDQPSIQAMLEEEDLNESESSRSN